MRALLQHLHRHSPRSSSDPSTMSLSQLAFPILLENLLRTSVGLVNVAFLSRISDGLVSAVSIANQYISICQIIVTAVATGTMVSINQAIGMRHYERINSLSTVAVAANTVLGLLFGSFFLFFSDIFLSIMEIDQSAFASSLVYLQIVGGGMVFQCVQIVLANLIRSLGKPRLPLIINLVINAVNLLGCALVVFAPELIPVSPACGIALANLTSQIVGLLITITVLGRMHVSISLRYLHPFPWADLKLALTIGIPNGANNIAYGTSQLVTTAIISHTGASMIAAKVYASNLIQYVAQICYAFAQAGIIMIGYRVGAGEFDEAVKLERRVTRIAVISNIVCSLLLMCVRIPLLRMFTQDEQILTIAASIIILDILVEIGRAINNTTAGALQAVGDVVYQLVVNQLSCWIVSVGLSYVFGIVLGWGLHGIWLAFALDETTRSLILLIRWRRKKWLPKAMAHREKVAAEGRA